MVYVSAWSLLFQNETVVCDWITKTTHLVCLASGIQHVFMPPIHWYFSPVESRWKTWHILNFTLRLPLVWHFNSEFRKCKKPTWIQWDAKGIYQGIFSRMNFTSEVYWDSADTKLINSIIFHLLIFSLNFFAITLSNEILLYIYIFHWHRGNLSNLW